MRTIRIYELDITYPEGSSTGEGESERYEEIEGFESHWVPRWPRSRRFLSRTAAIYRAERLAFLGCTVVVRQSEPIAFEAAPAALFEPQPSTPPAMECTSKEGL